MKHLLIGAAALALTAPAFADGHTAVTADTVLATVNGTDITLGHVIALRSRLPQEYLQLPDETLFDGMVDQIIQQQVLADATERTKAIEIGLENETRAFIAGQEIDRLSSQPIDEAAVQAAYEAAYGDAEAAPEFNASHILVETEEEALELVSALEGGADFADLARAESTGPSGPNGGQLGWFGPGMMVPEFEQAVTDLEAGAVSAPVQTQFGWHVIKLNETRQQEVPGLEQVRAEIEPQVQQAAVAAALDALTEAADVTRTEVEIDPALIRDQDLLSE
ncbi:peptidylprolyl isomerase [Jannaschia donghaensis]|uniref:Parvulin-like PPIase n=1 Tax=Jannaschia donghaensis TaxID=420998 RepID=A0A0M6YH59_9RHOB|nr:peptidylprolyl isomerase [Jannaschia donghaensis]CTQ49290.1 putative parvulin-type peptidyl-prolyl cis-trans isomerase precursor [Jannaschia donghaensis]